MYNIFPMIIPLGIFDTEEAKYTNDCWYKRNASEEMQHTHQVILTQKVSISILLGKFNDFQSICIIGLSDLKFWIVIYLKKQQTQQNSYLVAKAQHNTGYHSSLSYHSKITQFCLKT